MSTPEAVKFQAHSCRSMPGEHNRKQDGISNSLPQTRTFLPLSSLELCFHHHLSNNRSFQTLYRCEEADPRLVQPAMFPNQVLLHCEGLQATLLLHWIQNHLPGQWTKFQVDFQVWINSRCFMMVGNSTLMQSPQQNQLILVISANV
jgi:hypothetical protein